MKNAKNKLTQIAIKLGLIGGCFWIISVPLGLYDWFNKEDKKQELDKAHMAKAQETINKANRSEELEAKLESNEAVIKTLKANQETRVYRNRNTDDSNKYCTGGELQYTVTFRSYYEGTDKQYPNSGIGYEYYCESNLKLAVGDIERASNYHGTKGVEDIDKKVISITESPN
ncbi:hypothetical protein [Agarivorans aestuarii]|uniref:hypothetical protein n=1 Tax=Agarivorans aestuarii TaxID=1563703 RepID=UPI001C7F80E4|nr:hypothetical protein [Agarivorans aestuarii]